MVNLPYQLRPEIQIFVFHFSTDAAPQFLSKLARYLCKYYTGYFSLLKPPENGNGLRLLEMCTFHDLCIANSYFQTRPHSFLETPTLKALVPTGSDSGQMYGHQERSAHTLLPQHGLRHRPQLGVLQDQAATEEVPPH